MRDAAPTTIYLKNYTPFGYLVDSVHLDVRLSPHATRVKSRLAVRPNPEATDTTFFLHGENLTLISARINGGAANPVMTADGLTCLVPDGPFTWETEVEIDPANNTALEGLYMSNGMYCTQCEPEGFRKITYYPDRPDVMSVFTVRVEGDLPVLLSNGNPQGKGDGWAEWHDPWPKPGYLFALVAGDLVNHSDRFTTRSGNDVALNIWVRTGDEHKCAFAMKALKSAMAWDEQVYGREYDLDIFNIVAVDDFNMGAMENKGLNIFNSSAVLASPETSTDANFERIEAIIAHEYFHNCTGNRITCRDWFQLCLKEGLTVFRDSEFTSHMRSAPVKRVSDVIDLRTRQFPEDNGPLAHPVRPKSFQEISNFYTATVYEKGAEVIGMLKRLVGDDAYARALDLYFARHDGQACTVEDWLKVFEDTTDRNLTQFKGWYSQAGTPRLTVTETWYPAEAPGQTRGAAADAAHHQPLPQGSQMGTYILTFAQTTKPGTTAPNSPPRVLPIAVGLLNTDGTEVVPTTVLEMTEATQSFAFYGLATKPVPSILRGFSAPVILDRTSLIGDGAFLLAHDTDPFNRWEAGRSMALASLMAMATDGTGPDQAYLDGMATVLRDDGLDPAYRALMLNLPSQSELADALHEHGITPDPDAIWTVRKSMARALAQRCQDITPRIFAEMQVTEAYQPDAVQSGKRALAGAVLGLISRTDGGVQAAKQYEEADNMTLQLSALTCLLQTGTGSDQLAAFYTQWQHDRLVIDKWFALQTGMAAPGAAVRIANALTKHTDFNWKNPNRFRAIVGGLAMNHAGFHAQDGSGYRFVADWLIRLDPFNQQTTARMCTPFQTWRRYDKARQALIAAELDRIAATPDLSRDTTEMITRIRIA